MAYRKYDKTWFRIGCCKGDMCYKLEVPSCVRLGDIPSRVPLLECACFEEFGVFSSWMYASIPEEAVAEAWKHYSESYDGFGASVPLDGYPDIATENILLDPESYEWCVKHLKGFAEKVHRRG